MTDTPTSSPPGGLGDAGRDLWFAIHAGLPDGWELDEREAALLALAARQADHVAGLERVVAEDGLMAVGSTGQQVVNPAVQEARQGRQTINQLLGRISLPMPEKEGETSGSGHGRQAANARWAEQARQEARGRG